MRSNMDRTLVLVKPDAIQRGLAGNIINRLEGRGLRIVALKMLWMDEKLAQKHYAVHQNKPFFNDLVKFITACPIVAAVFEGKNAVEVVRQTMGETNAAKAASGTIRGDLAIDLQYNLVHGSDSPENAAKEISLFFSPGEIFEYTRKVDSWVTGS
jgi:nucleoside-diphosphate kinase